MKIILFNSFYYPWFVGGAEISVKLLAEGLVKRGNKVYVITIGAENKVERVNGVIVIRIKYQNVFSPYEPKKSTKFIKMIWLMLDAFNPFYHIFLKSILKRVDPEVIHTNNVMGFSPTIWFTIKQLRIPLVHTMRDYYLMCHKSNMFVNGKNCSSVCAGCQFTQKIKKINVNKPDIYVGVSNFMLDRHKSFLKRLSDDRKYVVYNAVEIPEKIERVIISKTKIVFGYIGRISEDKGVGYLVEELRRLNSKYTGKFIFVVAGIGESTYVEYLKKQMAEIEHQFLGKVKPDEFYNRVDVTIVPSQWNEPFGRVAIESLAYGVPACIADNGGLTEIHNENCTWLFKPKEENLIKILSEIVADPIMLEKKRAASRSYAAKFDVKYNIDSYLSIYTKLLDSNNNG